MHCDRKFTMTMTDVAAQFGKRRPQLLKYAPLQLRNSAWVGDAVSESLLAAIEKPLSFAGQAPLKTWLIGILKHRLIDPVPFLSNRRCGCARRARRGDGLQRTERLSAAATKSPRRQSAHPLRSASRAAAPI